MLSTSPRSRRRLAAGGALVSTLVLAGLGLTASGTSAAAALSGRVGDSIGVDLQVVPPVPPVPSAPPAEPVAPEAPQPPEAPEPPMAGKKVQRVIVNRIGKDGKVSTYTSSADGTFADPAIQTMVARSVPLAPDVTERQCSDGRDGGPHQFVIHATEGKNRTMVICTNRIETAAAAGAARSATAAALAIDTDKIRRDAMTNAIASVQASRAGIAANRDISASDRKEALAEMDAAIAELRAEMASPDKD